MSGVHRPKKHLGQNFLINPYVQQRIIQSCAFKQEDTVVEIGPGQGALSCLIAPLVRRLICVEADRDLIAPLGLSLPSSVEIIQADFLKWDMGHLPNRIKVIGNIPYYISTPIIEKLITERIKVSEAFLTVQKEFQERLTAKPGGKDFGSLTCFAEYYADIKMLFKINHASFKPAPKVDSAFIRLSMRSFKEKAEDEDFLFKLTQTAFSQRRKTIVNALKGLVPSQKLEKEILLLGLSVTARAENLSVLDYVALSNKLVL
ncbi:MAG: ribosomal RNA small subunit methyltransferase A [Candidatus Omnitrophica bacterium]|nr:ribosomal RNA small subunit methyltransferase A [Candidatus Omnitrophota bacterium]